MRRRRLAGVTLLLVAAAVLGGRAAPARAGGTYHTSRQIFRVQSVPPVAGLRFTFAGTTRTTGRAGWTQFTLTQAAANAVKKSPFGLVGDVNLVPQIRRDGTTYRVQRWYSADIRGIRTLRAAVDEFVPTKVSFVDPKSGHFEAKNVDFVRVKRSDGAVFTFRGKQLERPVMLKATRVVPLAGTLVSKNLLYRVQSVTIEGNNLVNRAQQAFLPAESPKVTLKLLFYSARFIARDRIFRFPIGSSITLEFPNGRQHVYKLDGSGTLLLPALPRGNYRVTVQAPGLKMKMPVAMTRDQVATLNVVSYLDVGTVLAVLLATAAGLLLVGRPALRRRLRQLLRRGRKERVPGVAKA